MVKMMAGMSDVQSVVFIFKAVLLEHGFDVQHFCGNFAACEAFSWVKEEVFRAVNWINLLSAPCPARSNMAVEIVFARD